jgi:hypothetical protein
MQPLQSLVVLAAWLFSLIIEDSPRALAHTTMRVLVNPAKKVRRSNQVRCLPTASTLPLKTNRDLGTSRWQLPRQWLDNTPVVMTPEETNQNKPAQ